MAVRGFSEMWHIDNPASLSLHSWGSSCSPSPTHQSRASKWDEVAFITLSLSKSTKHQQTHTHSHIHACAHTHTCISLVAQIINILFVVTSRKPSDITIHEMQTRWATTTQNKNAMLIQYTSWYYYYLSWRSVYSFKTTTFCREVILGVQPGAVYNKTRECTFNDVNSSQTWKKECLANTKSNTLQAWGCTSKHFCGLVLLHNSALGTLTKTT